MKRTFPYFLPDSDLAKFAALVHSDHVKIARQTNLSVTLVYKVLKGELRVTYNNQGILVEAEKLLSSCAA